MTLFEIALLYITYWKKTSRLDRLNNDLHYTNIQIDSIQRITANTDRNEYTEGFIDHCYRKIEDLNKKRERLMKKISKQTRVEVVKEFN